MITLYHGTNTPFDAIDLKQSKRYKDFNQAFYLSASKTQAQEMAESKAEFLGGNDTVGLQIRDFKRKHKGNIKSFLKGIKYIKGETFQYAFCTEKATKYLKRI